MNLLALKKSRSAPQAGDVFALLPPDDHGYLFGRVIDTGADPLGVGVGVLVYVYAARSPQKESVPRLLPDQLLVPPLITNRLPWSKGYFERVAHRPLEAADRLAQHCFYDSVRRRYVDERGQALQRAVEPVGQWGLDSYRTIDDAICKALGIALAPG